MTLLIIASALLWAFLPALITSYLTWKLLEPRYATGKAEVSRHVLLRAAEIFFAWLLVYGSMFGLLIYLNFRSVNSV